MSEQVINGKTYVPERTCLPVYEGKHDPNPKCSLCGEPLADGVLNLPKYCGECGARVIEK